jgi:FkbM family methyltransferase
MIQLTSTNDLHDSPRQKDLIYDVGMHKGEDTEFYLRKGFRVIAFEADPDLAGRCRKTLREFIEQGRLTIVEGAIIGPDSIAPGQKTIMFFKNETKSTWGTVCADWAERNKVLGSPSAVIEVNVVDFAGIMREHGVPYFLKIDVEGVDMVCVDALRQFRQRPAYVSLESDKTSLRLIELEIDSLSDLGYDSFQAVEQSGIPRFQSPPDPAGEGTYFAQKFEPGSSGLFGRELPERWRSQRQILRHYGLIRVGYMLVGHDGILTGRAFPGVSILQRLVHKFFKILTKSPDFAWFDTHARHSSSDTGGEA